MRLFIKLQVLVLLCFATVLAAFAWAQVVRERELFVADTTSDNRTMVRWLAEATAQTWAAGGRAAAESFVARAYADPGGARARLEPPARAATVSAAPRGRGTDGAPAGPGREDAGPGATRASSPLGEGGTALELDRSTGLESVVVRTPMLVDGRPVATLVLSESMSARDQYVARTLWRQLALAGAVLVVALALSTVLGYYVVGRRVAVIVRRAERAGQGDLDSRLRPAGRDELDQIAAELDAMCERLAVARAAEHDAAHARIQSMQQLRQAERLALVGTMASGMAHELGTPLSVVQIRAGEIRSGETAGAEAAASAAIIAEQAARMARLIRDLLDFSRPRAPDRAATDLVGLARRTVALLGPIAKRRGVEIEEPASTQPPVVSLVDAPQIEQVLSNLVINAVHAQAARPGAGPVSVAVGPDSAVAPTMAVISVTDHGQGMPPDLLARVFEPFVSTKAAGEGTGLGLTVSESLARENGGRIDAASTLGHGSVFRVFLPLADARSVAVPQPVGTPAPAALEAPRP